MNPITPSSSTNVPVLPTADVPNTPESSYAPAYLEYLSANSPAFKGKEKDVAALLARIDSATELGAETQVLLASLVKILATIRKEQRQLAMAQANNTFNVAKLNAQHQISQANNRYSAEIATATAGLVGGAIEAASAGASLAKGAISGRQIQKAADAQDWTKPIERPAGQTANADDGVDAPTKQGVDFYEAPPAYEAEASTSTRQIAAAKPDQFSLKKSGGPMDQATEEANTPAARTAPDLQAKSQWIAEQQRIAWQKADMTSRLMSAVSQMISSSIKMGGASWEREAGLKQAEITLQKAFEDYTRNQQNMSEEYARDMRDWLNKIIELLKSIESARHRTFENLLV